MSDNILLFNTLLRQDKGCLLYFIKEEKDESTKNKADEKLVSSRKMSEDKPNNTTKE